MPETTLKRHENVGLGNSSGHFDIFCQMLSFFPRRNLPENHDGLRGRDRPQGVQMDQKAVNLLPVT